MSASRTGFTLLELLVTLAIAAVLVSLSVYALSSTNSRARARNAALELSALYSTAQARATARGLPHYVIFHDDGRHAGAWLLERADSEGRMEWAGAPLSALREAGTRVDSLALDSAGLAFLPLDSLHLRPRPLPGPFSSIPLAPSGPQGLLAGCSFCTGSAGSARGVIRFSPDGTVRLETGEPASATGGGVLAVIAGSEQSPQGPVQLVVLSAPAGAVRVF